MHFLGQIWAGVIDHNALWVVSMGRRGTGLSNKLRRKGDVDKPRASNGKLFGDTL